MKIDVHSDERVIVVKIIGDYNIEGMHTFSTIIMNEIRKKPPAIALDFTGLVYIDSSGIGSIMRYMNMAKKDGVDFFCFGLNEDIGHIFMLTKLDQVLKVFTVEEFYMRYPALAKAGSN